MQDILTFLSSVFTSGLLTSGLIFLFRNWISERIKNSIKHEYDLKLQEHKIDLEKQSAKELTELKGRLEIAAAERNIQYSKVFSKTEEVIAEIYKKTVLYQKASSKYVMSESYNLTRDGSSELYEDSYKVGLDLMSYFNLHRIYLSEDISKKIEGLATKIGDLSDDRLLLTHGEKEKKVKDNEARVKIMEKTLVDVPRLLRELEDEFRKQFGIPIKQSSEPEQGK